jgi:hypothetical protein
MLHSIHREHTALVVHARSLAKKRNTRAHMLSVARSLIVRLGLCIDSKGNFASRTSLSASQSVKLSTLPKPLDKSGESSTTTVDVECARMYAACGLPFSQERYMKSGDRQVSLSAREYTHRSKLRAARRWSPRRQAYRRPRQTCPTLNPAGCCEEAPRGQGLKVQVGDVAGGTSLLVSVRNIEYAAQIQHNLLLK